MARVDLYYIRAVASEAGLRFVADCFFSFCEPKLPYGVRTAWLLFLRNGSKAEYPRDCGVRFASFPLLILTGFYLIFRRTERAEQLGDRAASATEQAERTCIHK